MSAQYHAAASRTVQHKSLSAYYRKLYHLEELLSSSGDSHDLNRPSDPAAYRDLLSGAICGLVTHDAAVSGLPILEPVQRGQGPSHSEVVDAILHELSRRTYAGSEYGGRGRDTLLLGLTVSCLGLAYPSWTIEPTEARKKA
jgi:hypothetical protein